VAGPQGGAAGARVRQSRATAPGGPLSDHSKRVRARAARLSQQPCGDARPAGADRRAPAADRGQARAARRALGEPGLASRHSGARLGALGHPARHPRSAGGEGLLVLPGGPGRVPPSADQDRPPRRRRGPLGRRASRGGGAAGGKLRFLAAAPSARGGIAGSARISAELGRRCPGRLAMATEPGPALRKPRHRPRRPHPHPARSGDQRDSVREPRSDRRDRGRRNRRRLGGRLQASQPGRNRPAEGAALAARAGLEGRLPDVVADPSASASGVPRALARWSSRAPAESRSSPSRAGGEWPMPPRWAGAPASTIR
jgi:hypothetical protein